MGAHTYSTKLIMINNTHLQTIPFETIFIEMNNFMVSSVKRQNHLPKFYKLSLQCPLWNNKCVWTSSYIAYSLDRKSERLYPVCFPVPSNLDWLGKSIASYVFSRNEITNK